MSVDAELSRQLSAYLTAPRWLVAYSGGLDSTVLLHAVVDFARRHDGPPVAAIHVNHGLSAQADAWQAHCEAQCAALDVQLYANRVDVPVSGVSLEQAARAARYDCFTQHLGSGELLLQAHHVNDQAETVLFRLLRSAGVNGLAGIPRQRPLAAGHLLRPLLTLPRAALEQYAREHSLHAVQDESNADIRFDRNYIRHQILPVITQRWPNAVAALAQSAQFAADASTLADELAALDLVPMVASNGTLSVSALRDLSPARQANALRYWLAQRALVPSPAQLAQIQQQLLAESAAATAEVLVAGQQLHHYDGYLYCESRYDLTAVLAHDGALWDGQAPLMLAPAIELSAQPLARGGVLLNWPLRISFGPRSARFKPAWRTHSTSVKKLMQAQKVLPWHRPVVPLLSIDNELAAVPGLGVDARFMAAEEQRGYRICLTICGYSYLCE